MENHEHHHHESHEHHHEDRIYHHKWAFLGDLEKLGNDYLIKKAPFLMPLRRKEFVAKVLPVLVILFGVVAIPAALGMVLFFLGFGSFFLNGAYRGAGMYPIVLIQLILTVVMIVLYFKSYNLLRGREYTGWVYVFYTTLLSFVGNLLSGSVFRAIIGLLVSMYILFQIKVLYHR